MSEDEPVYGIMDPDYARFFSKARCVAKSHGYALALHGTFTRDLDVVAVPWTAKPSSAATLVANILSATDMRSPHAMTVKDHSRRVWTLQFPTPGDPRFIDFSVMPRAGECADDLPKFYKDDDGNRVYLGSTEADIKPEDVASYRADGSVEQLTNGEFCY